MSVNVDSDRVTLNFKDSSAVILNKGATVISWKAPNETLFLSAKADITGTKAIRGGIPVVFPFFGPQSLPEHKGLSQHGFARTSVWRVDPDEIVSTDPQGVSVALRLDHTKLDQSIKDIYPRPFSLIYVVRLTSASLTTELHVSNTWDKTFEDKVKSEKLQFQALFHNYLLLADSPPSSNLVEKVSISGLGQQPYLDKVSSDPGLKRTDKSDKVFNTSGKPTDSVYFPSTPGKHTIEWADQQLQIETERLPQTVTWNPGDAASMGDMEDQGWTKFVCVEPGHVGDFIEIAAGETWIGKQTLKTRTSRL